MSDFGANFQREVGKCGVFICHSRVLIELVESVILIRVSNSLLVQVLAISVRSKIVFFNGTNNEKIYKQCIFVMFGHYLVQKYKIFRVKILYTVSLQQILEYLGKNSDRIRKTFLLIPNLLLEFVITIFFMFLLYTCVKSVESIFYVFVIYLREEC
eukprot:TRINITY_DN2951_c1_g2_i5.p2 TRINITY_DN2951_c1_g2~~TRINITY_DN2951_c1_g2_i5.p2  ORF type:complete len:156 (-),score=1.60 TRINITY_DN2951_c1_g2_i5:27-494(-)